MTAHELGGPPIFVGGMPRSGTTLAANLVGSHSEIALPPAELGFFNAFWRPGDSPSRRMHGHAELEEPLQRLLPRLRRWDLSDEDVRETARAADETYRGLFVALLELYRRRAEKSRIAEKSVNYHRWLYVLDAWFDDYRFVHVVRHPVDAFASYKWLKRGTRRPNQVEVVPWINDWNLSATVALHRSHARSDRYCCVRYEDLCDRTADVLDAICMVAGIPPQSERMMQLDEVDDVDNSSFVDEGAGAAYVGRIRKADDVRRAELIDRRELAAIRSACAPLAHLLGYDLALPRARRGRVGQPQPGRLPPVTAIAFVAHRVSGRLLRR